MDGCSWGALVTSVNSSSSVVGEGWAADMYLGYGVASY